MILLCARYGQCRAHLWRSAEICALMLFGLLAGATLTQGSPLKGIAMMFLGLLLVMVGHDVQTACLALRSESRNSTDGV